jgi:uncharacterized lipoprotein NlpE involved in copper resistance
MIKLPENSTTFQFIVPVDVPVVVPVSRYRWVTLIAVAIALTGCGNSNVADQPTQLSASASSAGEITSSASVSLTPQELEKLAIATSTAQDYTFTPEVEGYGLVLDHETIAQRVADVLTAHVAVQQSQSALARMHQLADTPGAYSQENSENIVRQAAADQAALTLAQRKLSATLGLNPPWQAADENATLAALASSNLKLVRVTFPLDALHGEPKSLRIARLSNSSTRQNWSVNQIWNAPADSAMPGRSYFALLKSADLSEGEHVMVWAPVGASEHGVLVPGDAIVISEGSYWCYVQTAPGSFKRVPVDSRQPVDDGYFVREGLKAGDVIVTQAASLILARESGSVSQAD